jgi:hypothetical protein
MKATKTKGNGRCTEEDPTKGAQNKLLSKLNKTSLKIDNGKIRGASMSLKSATKLGDCTTGTQEQPCGERRECDCSFLECPKEFRTSLQALSGSDLLCQALHPRRPSLKRNFQGKSEELKMHGYSDPMKRLAQTKQKIARTKCGEDDYVGHGYNKEVKVC